MAERQRFELWKVLPPCRFSRPVLSTAQPSLLIMKHSITVSSNFCQNIQILIPNYY